VCVKLNEYAYTVCHAIVLQKASWHIAEDN